MCFKIRFQLKRHFFALFPYIHIFFGFCLYNVLCILCFSLFSHSIYLIYIYVCAVLSLFYISRYISIQSTIIFWHITNNYIICGMYVHVSNILNVFYIYIVLHTCMNIIFCLFTKAEKRKIQFSQYIMFALYVTQPIYI